MITDPTSAYRSVAQILFVCTANRCRSPYMELAFADMVSHEPGLTMASAGTEAIDGEPIAAPMLEILAVQGIDGTSFRSRSLSSGLVASASMVLTADRDQAGRVCRLWPSALRRVFTLRQAARLLSDGGLLSRIEPAPDRLEGMSRLAEMMASERGLSGPSLADDEVVDPWQRSHDVYLKSARTMQPALQSVATALQAAVGPAVTQPQ